MSLAREITKRLGGDWCGHYGLVSGPRHSKHDRSLKVMDDGRDPPDVVVHSYAGDDWKAVKDEWRRMGLLPWRDFRETTPKPIRDPERDRKAKAEREAEGAKRLGIVHYLWDLSEPAEGTIVANYLRSRRIEIAPLPRTLRFLPANPPQHLWDAMLAPFAIAREPEPGLLGIPRQNIKGIHLTRLRPDGNGKAPIDKPKTMHGSCRGFPVVLAPLNDGLGLLLGEGIETTLTAHQETGLGAWAAGAAGFMPALADLVPHYIECVTILREDDSASARFSEELAQRLDARGFEVILSGVRYGT